jgi:hypothetical protein
MDHDYFCRGTRLTTIMVHTHLIHNFAHLASVWLFAADQLARVVNRDLRLQNVLLCQTVG